MQANTFTFHIQHSVRDVRCRAQRQSATHMHSRASENIIIYSSIYMYICIPVAPCVCSVTVCFSVEPKPKPKLYSLAVHSTQPTKSSTEASRQQQNPPPPPALMTSVAKGECWSRDVISEVIPPWRNVECVAVHIYTTLYSHTRRATRSTRIACLRPSLCGGGGGGGSTRI